jgi:RNA polymerase sigma factor (sigma-70 family)
VSFATVTDRGVDPLHASSIEDLLRELAPQVLASLLRRGSPFDAAEDAVQEALVAATRQWDRADLPRNPKGWLVTVARRRLTDELRSRRASRRREIDDAQRGPADVQLAPAADADARPAGDDTLTLLFLCCHPSLSQSSQLALTLRAVCGLSTGEIARAFFVPESTMGQRISRAKQHIRDSGPQFVLPDADEFDARLQVVLHALYLLFNEGYTTSAGTDLVRADLTVEAIRLARAVHRALPDDGEVQGLLALMILNDARRAARTSDDGSLVPLAEQDRGLWDSSAIEEGVALITDALTRRPLGPYQLQAAIAAVHVEAPSSDETDWPQIVGLYELLMRIAPNPMVTLNHAVAVAFARGPRAGLALLAPLDDDPRMATHHRLAAVRGHLLELAGDAAAAYEQYRLAARRTTSRPERHYLEARAARLKAQA